MNILFSPPDMTEMEVEEVVSVIRSGWITTGPKVKEFEKLIKDYLNIDNAVCLNSQTACAEIAFRLLGVGVNDEVIVPAYTYTASASVVDHVGAKIVFVDIQKDNLEMDYDLLENSINENTKAIISVDLAGIPCDYDKLYSIVNSKKHIFKPCNKIQETIGRIAICADGAHSFGAKYKNKSIGSVADFTSFSFHAVKNLTTGEGGALTWKSIEGIDDKEIYHIVQLYSLHGQSKDAFHKNQLGCWEYDVKGPWYKCNMTDICAALGVAQLKRYDSLLQRRKEIINRYNEGFKDLNISVLNHYTDNYSSSGHLYITRVLDASLEKRNEIIIKMAEKGIACNVHYKPLPMMTAYKNLGYDIKDYPVAYSKFVNETTLPLHTKLTNEEVDYVIDTFKDIIK